MVIKIRNIIDYMGMLKKQEKAENTLITYGFHLKCFYTWVRDNGFELSEVKQADMVDFRDDLLTEGKNHRTINAILSCVRGLYDYLILKEVAMINPVPKQMQLKVTTKTVEPLTQEEFLEFIAYFNNLQENIRCAFLTMATTGARVGEIAALKKGDFLMKNRRLCIDIKNAKWGSDRVVPILHKKSARIIKKYVNELDIYEQPAFRLSKRTLQSYAQKFKTDTGIDLHCHKLRHTIATRLIEQGVPFVKVQHLLGHRSAYVTQQYTSRANVDLMDIVID